VTTRTALACAGAALAIAGCGNEERSDDTTESAQQPATQGEGPAAPSAKVSFTAPKDGSTLGSKFTAKVKLQNFELNAKTVGKSPVPGQGHLHFQLDGGRFDVPQHSGPNGKLAKQLGVDGKYSPALETTITYTGVPPGKHTLEVYLANNNHTDTGVEAETEFTVK
jgi:hypothetical protein